MEGVIYVNTGDFVESCSLVVEHRDGRFEVLHWKTPCSSPRGSRTHLVRGRGGGGASGRGASGSGLMRILIATDAWRPQVNGVVSTLERMTQAAAEFGAEFEFLTPQGMWSAPLPSYPEIRLALPNLWRIGRQIEAAAPDHIHIATEGPIGWLTRHYCLRATRIFTTSYHTRFPEYVSARFGVPEWLTYAWLRNFHSPSAAVMAPTPTIARRSDPARLRAGQALDPRRQPRLFPPADRATRSTCRGRSFSRLAGSRSKKTSKRCSSLDLPGSTVIVGDGPARRSSSAAIPTLTFSAQHGEALADIYASADVFVFPSRTDTFGIVLIEAMASGLPVAAFPVARADRRRRTPARVLDEDLRAACLKALTIPREKAREHSLRFTWKESARQFLDNIETCRSERRQPASPPERVGVARAAGRLAALRPFGNRVAGPAPRRATSQRPSSREQTSSQRYIMADRKSSLAGPQDGSRKLGKPRASAIDASQDQLLAV